MATNDIDVIDRLVMATSGALMVVGIVVLGLVEVLDGKPYGAAPMTNEAGEIVATPGVDPNIRTGLVFVGLLLLGLWAVYRVAVPHLPADRTPATDTDMPAD